MKQLAVPLLVALLLAGCGGSSAPAHIAVKSPEATALAWFSAINAHNMPLAVAHFAPADRGQMAWSDFDSVTFSNVQCALQSETQSESKRLFATHSSSSQASASVMCTFTPHVPSGNQVEHDGFWTVYLHKVSSGPWLITSYGTG